MIFIIFAQQSSFMMSILRSILILGLLIMAEVNSFAQVPCNPNITPSSNATLAYRPRNNRCEGFYRAKVAANALRLVSITSGEFRFTAQATELIEIKTSASSGQVKFSAEGIPNDLYYRLDAEFPAKTGFSWPVKDVLLKETRTQDARNIGLLAKLDQYYLPIQAKGKSANADSNPQTLIKFVCTTRISQVLWRVAGQANFTTMPGNSFPAGRPITLRLPATMKGKNTIEIRARAEDNTDWMNLSVPLQL